MAACCDGSKVAGILRAKLSGDLCDEGRYIYLSFMLIRQNVGNSVTSYILQTEFNQLVVCFTMKRQAIVVST